MGQVNDNGLSPNEQVAEKKAKYEKLQKTVWSDMKSRPFDKLGPGDLRAIDATYEKVMADENQKIGNAQGPGSAGQVGAEAPQSGKPSGNSGNSAGAIGTVGGGKADKPPVIDAPKTVGNDSLPDGDESEDDGEPNDAPAF